MAIILRMTETLSLAEVRARFSEMVDQVEGQHDRVIVTRNGKPAAILISPEDLESLEETLAVLSDPAAMSQIEEARAGHARGESISLAELRRELAGQ